MALPFDVASLQTPCFVFDEAELRQNFSDFRRALADHWSPHANVAYSVKTNPFPWILEVARDEGCYAEVVSNEEYARALQCGFVPEKIVFNGPIKGRDWLFYALDAGSYVNLDSKREIEWVREYAESGKSARVGLRANILLEKHCPGRRSLTTATVASASPLKEESSRAPSKSCGTFRASSCADCTCM